MARPSSRVNQVHNQWVLATHPIAQRAGPRQPIQRRPSLRQRTTVRRASRTSRVMGQQMVALQMSNETVQARQCDLALEASTTTRRLARMAVAQWASTMRRIRVKATASELTACRTGPSQQRAVPTWVGRATNQATCSRSRIKSLRRKFRTLRSSSSATASKSWLIM